MGFAESEFPRGALFEVATSATLGEENGGNRVPVRSSAAQDVKGKDCVSRDPPSEGN